MKGPVRAYHWPSLAAVHPARPVRGRAFGRIDDTLSVVDEGTGLTL